MARTHEGAEQGEASGTSPRRAGLLQQRSRETRRRLVRTAVDLWTQRGFETGIEDTTVEEIAQAAGVTKGTFYFHFARKEQILLDMGLETAARLSTDSQRYLEADLPIQDSLRRMMNALAKQVKAAPPAAVGRVLAEFRRPNQPDVVLPRSPAFADAFEPLFAKAQEAGELTDAVPAAEMAQILEALVTDTIMEWSQGRSPLNAALHRRTAIVLSGLRPGADLLS